MFGHHFEQTLPRPHLLARYGAGDPVLRGTVQAAHRSAVPADACLWLEARLNSNSGDRCLSTGCRLARLEREYESGRLKLLKLTGRSAGPIENLEEHTMSNLSLWIRRDPLADLDGTLNAIIRRTFGPAVHPAIRPAGFVPAADLGREDDDAVVRLELPGLDVEKDVSVEIDRGRLVVKGERRSERSTENDGRTLREVRYGSFERLFRLPEHVTADAVTARYDAGVLTVRVTGAYTVPEPTAHRIAVTTGRADAPVVEAPAESGEDGQPAA